MRPLVRRLTRALVALLLPLAAAACDRQDRPPRTQLVAGGDPAIGKTRFARYGCTSCHAIPGVPGAHGSVGPSLAKWADRRFVGGVLPNSPDRLVHWIMDPPSVNPRTAMPRTGATEPDAKHMAAYLYTLR